MKPKSTSGPRRKRTAVTYERTGEYAGSISGYHLGRVGYFSNPFPPSFGEPISARFRAPFAGSWLLLFSSRERMTRGITDYPLYVEDRVTDGDALIRAGRARGLRL